MWLERFANEMSVNLLDCFLACLSFLFICLFSCVFVFFSFALVNHFMAPFRSYVNWQHYRSRSFAVFTSTLFFGAVGLYRSDMLCLLSMVLSMRFMLRWFCPSTFS